MSAALRGSKLRPASSAAVPVVIRSWGYPSRSPTLTWTCPIPAWVRLSQSPDASVPPPTSARQGKVYAIEKREDALELLRENRERFHLRNLELIPGAAPLGGAGENGTEVGLQGGDQPPDPDDRVGDALGVPQKEVHPKADEHGVK